MRIRSRSSRHANRDAAKPLEEPNHSLYREIPLGGPLSEQGAEDQCKAQQNQECQHESFFTKGRGRRCRRSWPSPLPDQAGNHGILKNHRGDPSPSPAIVARQSILLHILLCRGTADAVKSKRDFRRRDSRSRPPKTASESPFPQSWKWGHAESGVDVTRLLPIFGRCWIAELTATWPLWLTEIPPYDTGGAGRTDSENRA